MNGTCQMKSAEVSKVLKKQQLSGTPDIPSDKKFGLFRYTHYTINANKKNIKIKRNFDICDKNC